MGMCWPGVTGTSLRQTKPPAPPPPPPVVYGDAALTLQAAPPPPPPATTRRFTEVTPVGTVNVKVPVEVKFTYTIRSTGAAREEVGKKNKIQQNRPI
jgi:hypothetical protein